MKKLILKASSYNYFILTYVATLIFSFHYYFITYINSSYLSKFIGSENTGALYALGSVLNIILFFNFSKILKRFGNYRTMLFFIVVQVLCLSLISFSTSIPLLVVGFILHHAVNPLLVVGLDLFLEHISKTENVGTTRGIFLTIIALTAVISPFLVGSLLNEQSYQMIYMISLSFILIFFFVIYHYFKNYKDIEYKTSSGLAITEHFIKNKSVRQIFITNLMLQIFYSWMIIYIPIYLNQYIGFTWKEIGLIISVSILPFVLFEIPLGKLADKKIGEKEILVLGFLIMISSLFIIGQIDEKNIILWMILLTLARSGASFVEVASETYFFKQITETDEELGEFWRIANPIGFIIGTLIGTVALIILPYQYIFFVLALILIVGLTYALKIKDTR